MTTSPSTSRGSAMTEALVSMLALLPFFVFIPLLGKHGHVQFKANETLRYAIWERTVWQNEDGLGGGPTSGDSNATKSDDWLRIEAMDRIVGHPRAGIRAPADLSESGITVNPMLTDMAGASLFADASGSGSSLATTTTVTASPMDIAAAAGARDRFGLDNGNFLRSSVTLRTAAPIRRWNRFRLGHGHEPGIDDQSGSRPSELLAHARKGALLTDTWLAPSEATFRNRIVRGTHAIESELLTVPALDQIRSISDDVGETNPNVSADWAFGEARYGANARLTPSSAALPGRYSGSE